MVRQTSSLTAVIALSFVAGATIAATATTQNWQSDLAGC